MALTFSQFVGDGLTRSFAVSFPYISKTHVKVRVDGTAVSFTWPTPALVQLTEAPAAGSVIDIRRETPNTEPLVDFHDGSTLVESDLDLATIQSLYLAQELVDALSSKLGFGSDGAVDAGGRRVKNVAPPIEADDATTKGYVDTAIGDAPGFAAQAKASADVATDKAQIAVDKASTATTAAAQAVKAANDTALLTGQAFYPLFFVATEGQTTFPLGTTVNPATTLVFRNGVWQRGDGVDYNLTATTLTFVEGVKAGHLISVAAFNSFAVADTLKMSGNLTELADKAIARQNLGVLPLDTLTWEAGASEVEALISPKKLKDTVSALLPTPVSVPLATNFTDLDIINATGNYIVPADIDTSVNPLAFVFGAGGGGGSTTSGNAGGLVIGTPSLTPGETIAVTVGSSTQSGTAGSTTFKGMVATGGTAGPATTTGSGSGGDLLNSYVTASSFSQLTGPGYYLAKALLGLPLAKYRTLFGVTYPSASLTSLASVVPYNPLAAGHANMLPGSRGTQGTFGTGGAVFLFYRRKGS